MPGRLDGKVAVITGGTSGIGEATARRFVAEGARVVIAGRAEQRGNALSRELGEQAFFFRADVMHESEIAALIDAAVSRFGQLDCLFNNAGAATPGEIDTVTEEQFDYGMRLLVGSVMFGIKHAARAMQSRGGTIINNSSIAAHRLGQGGTLYSAAKAAVSHVTRIAGAKLGPNGIRVNSISPGAIATPIFWGGSAKAQTLSEEENARKLAKLEGNLARATPLPRSGVANDIAYAAVFLASDEGSFINSHDLVVDGGRIAQFYERPASGT
jgi:NAD(P)-dependent dehydrogenase (short-subunit alcohol dehydrogenase family)